MEREYGDEKVIISRKRLEELEQGNNMLKSKIEEERKKFKDSATYCIRRDRGKCNFGYFVDETIFTNSEILENVFDKNQKLTEELNKLTQNQNNFFEKPWYKRIYYAINKKL